MDDAARLNLEGFRRVVVADAAVEAAGMLSEAQADAERSVAEARSRARAILDEARAGGVADGELAVGADLRRARADARRQVLGGRAAALEELRATTEAELASASPDERLCHRLEVVARQQLGDDAEIAQEGGGIVARAGRRRVDYRLPALADRCIRRLGPELERLWR